MDEEIKQLVNILRKKFSNYLLVGIDNKEPDNKTLSLTMNPKGLKECIDAMFNSEEPVAKQLCNILVDSVQRHIKDREIKVKDYKFSKFLSGETEGLTNEEIDEFLDRIK